MTTKFLTVAQFAESKGVSAPTVYKWVRDGAIQCVKSGRSTLISSAERAPANKRKSRKIKPAAILNRSEPNQYDLVAQSANQVIGNVSSTDLKSVENTPSYLLWKNNASRLLGQSSPQVSPTHYLREALFVQMARFVLDVPPKAFPSIFETGRIFTECDIDKIMGPIASTIMSSSWQDRIQLIVPRIHHAIIPREDRYGLGQYFTPKQIANEMVRSLQAQAIGSLTESGLRVLDPSCGLGIFLVSYALSMPEGSEVHLVGVDANWGCAEGTMLCLWALAKNQTHNRKITYEVWCFDFVVERWKSQPRTIFSATVEECRGIPAAEEPFYKNVSSSLRSLYEAGWQRSYSGLAANVAVGNPPWLQWSALNEEYRKKMAVQWKESGLFIAKGWASKVAAGKTDISMLFVYLCAAKHLLPDSWMTFLVPIALFQGRKAGEGFRSFHTSNGINYALTLLDDYSSVASAFSDASNRPSAGYWQVGRKSSYPIPYRRFTEVPANLQTSRLDSLQVSTHVGAPLSGSQTDPIVVLDEELQKFMHCIGPSEYRARGGVNTGGANPILYLNSEDGIVKNRKFVTVQNIGRTRKSEAPVVSSKVEVETVYEMLRGVDISRWNCQPSGFMFLPYSSENPKNAIPELTLKKKFPRALEFIENFRHSLVSRKEYIRWGAKGPFYESFRIGPYTFAKNKVVWQHTGFRGQLKAAIPSQDALGRVVIPDQKVILLAAESASEAHYICAYLNSSLVSRILSTYLGIDASTHILDFIGLKQYDPNSELHVELSALSRKAHKNASLGKPNQEIEDRIDSIIERFLGR